MIRLFASDLDGTLLNPLHSVDRVICDAVGEVIRAGAHMVLATGRTARSASAQGFGDLPLEIVGSNGSIIRDGSGAVLKSFAIDPGVLEDMLRAFPGVCFDCVAPEGTFITGTPEERNRTFARDGMLRRIRTRGMRARMSTDPTVHFSQSVEAVLVRRICKINCRVPDAGLSRELASYLDEHADTLVNAPFSPIMFEISQVGVDKGAGLAWLASYLGIDEDEVAVYGDGGNDIAMLERFRHSYAPSNASEAAKRAASEVIGPNMFHAVPRHMVQTLHAERGRVVIE